MSELMTSGELLAQLVKLANAPLNEYHCVKAIELVTAEKPRLEVGVGNLLESVASKARENLVVKRYLDHARAAIIESSDKF